MKGSEILDKMQAGEAGKGGGDDAAAQAAAKAASDAVAAKAVADAAAAAAKAKADAGAPTEFDPTDLIEEGEEPGKTEELPKYEEVAKDEVKRKAAFASMSKKIGELQSELKEVRAKGGGEPSAREKELQKQLGQFNLMEDEDFKKDYIAPVGEAWQQVAVNLKSLGIADNKIVALQRATLAQRAEMLKDHAAALPFLSPLFADYDRKQAIARQELAKGSEKIAELRANRSKRIEIDVAASAEPVLEDLAKRHKFLAKKDGDEARNKRIDSYVSEAQKMAVKYASDPKAAFEAAMLSIAAKLYGKELVRLSGELTQAQKDKLQRARGLPKIGGEGVGGKAAGNGERADLKGVPASRKTQVMVDDMAQRFGH